MKQVCPRIMIAGTNSGCGKTTLVSALLKNLLDHHFRLRAFKVGPDYIDPMFHSKAIGAPSGNLDPFFYEDETLHYLLGHNAAQRDLTLLEGVMGYYDGLDFTSSEASSFALARRTQTPVVLVVNGRGAARSLLALLEGFFNFEPESGIRGVIFNRVSKGVYDRLKEAVSDHFGDRLLPLGFLPKDEAVGLGSRYLGLQRPEELTDLQKTLRRLSQLVEENIDREGLLRLAASAPDLEITASPFQKRDAAVRIGLARDRAFCFYYEENLLALRQLGAELVEFSPLDDAALPEKLDGLYLAGGYPELYMDRFQANESMRASLKESLDRGLPCIAECGGFMALTQEIDGKEAVGFFPGGCENQGHLVRFGYVTLTAEEDSMLLKKGEEVPAHEFHYYDASLRGKSYRARKRSGRSWPVAYCNDHLYAGYPHLAFFSEAKLAARFYQACLNFQKKREEGK